MLGPLRSSFPLGFPVQWLTSPTQEQHQRKWNLIFFLFSFNPSLFLLIVSGPVLLRPNCRLKMQSVVCLGFRKCYFFLAAVVDYLCHQCGLVKIDKGSSDTGLRTGQLAAKGERRTKTQRHNDFRRYRDAMHVNRKQSVTHSM